MQLFKVRINDRKVVITFVAIVFPGKLSSHIFTAFNADVHAANFSRTNDTFLWRMLFCQSLFQSLSILTLDFSCEICEIFQNTYFEEHLRTNNCFHNFKHSIQVFHSILIIFLQDYSLIFCICWPSLVNEVSPVYLVSCCGRYCRLYLFLLMVLCELVITRYRLFSSGSHFQQV